MFHSEMLNCLMSENCCCYNYSFSCSVDREMEKPRKKEIDYSTDKYTFLPENLKQVYFPFAFSLGHIFSLCWSSSTVKPNQFIIFLSFRKPSVGLNTTKLVIHTILLKSLLWGPWLVSVLTSSHISWLVELQ